MEGKKRFHLSARRYTQLLAAVLYNSNFKGFFTGKIFRGNIKGTCLPGLNCYSCPGAIGACPLGSLQSGLVNVSYKFPFYGLGTLLLFGLFMGRFICGFLCPFGTAGEHRGRKTAPPGAAGAGEDGGREYVPLEKEGSARTRGGRFADAGLQRGDGGAELSVSDHDE